MKFLISVTSGLPRSLEKPCTLGRSFLPYTLTLHHLNGSIRVNGNSLYEIIDGMADEELIDQEKQDKKAQCKKGKLVEKENCQVGNVSCL